MKKKKNKKGVVHTGVYIVAYIIYREIRPKD